jgi:hypothetical protein
VFDTHVPFFFSSLPLDDLKLTQQTGSQFSTREFFGIKKSRISSEFSHKPSPTASDLDSLAVSGGRTRELRLCNWVCGHDSWQECRAFPWFFRIRNRSVMPMVAALLGKSPVSESLLDDGFSGLSLEDSRI